MPMTGPTLSAKILTGFTAAGFIGVATPLYANAIGNGAMLEIIGKPFDTTDTGTSSGAGAGVGVGLIGIVGAAIAAQIQLAIIAFTGLPPTPDMIKMTNAIGDGVEQEVLLASLVSSHSPTHAGVGVITVGSIGVVGSAVSNSIKNLGVLTSFLGSEWADMAGAIGNGIGDSFLLATGNVVISGAGSGTGAHSGPNAVSPAGVLL